jgi:hypothetical protein
MVERKKDDLTPQRLGSHFEASKRMSMEGERKSMMRRLSTRVPRNLSIKNKGTPTIGSHSIVEELSRTENPGYCSHFKSMWN